MQGLLLSIVFNEYLPTPAQILNLSFGFEQMYLLKKAYGEMFFTHHLKHHCGWVFLASFQMYKTIDMDKHKLLFTKNVMCCKNT